MSGNEVEEVSKPWKWKMRRKREQEAYDPFGLIRMEKGTWKCPLVSYLFFSYFFTCPRNHITDAFLYPFFLPSSHCHLLQETPTISLLLSSIIIIIKHKDATKTNLFHSFPNPKLICFLLYVNVTLFSTYVIQLWPQTYKKEKNISYPSYNNISWVNKCKR